MTTSPGTTRRHAVILPVKPPAVGKSRLARLGTGPRTALAQAFAVDTAAAALACPLVERVLVVTDDHVLARELTALGAEVLPDGTTDLNGTLAQGAAEMHRRDPTLRLVALCADLPALRPDELTVALEAADPVRMSFLADQERVGTTLVVAPDLETFRPAFGVDSRSEHLAEGAVEIDGIDVPSLRRDVDQPDDLQAAVRLGVGPRTRSVTADLGM